MTCTTQLRRVDVARADRFDWWCDLTANDPVATCAGAFGLEQARTIALIERGEFVPYDSSRPFSSASIAGNGQGRLIILHLPKRARGSG